MKKNDPFLIVVILICVIVIALFVMRAEFPSGSASLYPTYMNVTSVELVRLENDNSGVKSEQRIYLDQEDAAVLLTALLNIDLINGKDRVKARYRKLDVTFLILEGDTLYYANISVSDEDMVVRVAADLENKYGEKHNKRLYACLIGEQYREDILGVLTKYERLSAEAKVLGEASTH